jgi:hypothetical protein
MFKRVQTFAAVALVGAAFAAPAFAEQASRPMHDNHVPYHRFGATL